MNGRLSNRVHDESRSYSSRSDLHSLSTSLASSSSANCEEDATHASDKHRALFSISNDSERRTDSRGKSAGSRSANQQQLFSDDIDQVRRYESIVSFCKTFPLPINKCRLYILEEFLLHQCFFLCVSTDV